MDINIPFIIYIIGLALIVQGYFFPYEFVKNGSPITLGGERNHIIVGSLLIIVSVAVGLKTV